MGEEAWMNWALVAEASEAEAEEMMDKGPVKL